MDKDEEEPAAASAARPLVVLNPRILRRSKVHDLDWEGCLSIPDYAALVARPRRISVAYETLDGEYVEDCTLSSNAARVFQHEVDHLDGVLYTERMIPSSLTHVSAMDDSSLREEIETLEFERWAASAVGRQGRR